MICNVIYVYLSTFILHFQASYVYSGVLSMWPNWLKDPREGGVLSD